MDDRRSFLGVIITAEKRSRINQCDRFAVGWIEVRKAQDYYGLRAMLRPQPFFGVWMTDDRFCLGIWKRHFALNRFYGLERSFRS